MGSGAVTGGRVLGGASVVVVVVVGAAVVVGASVVVDSSVVASPETSGASVSSDPQALATRASANNAAKSRLAHCLVVMIDLLMVGSRWS
jgi:predicted metalloprotease